MNTKYKTKILLAGAAVLVAVSALLSANGIALITVNQGISVHCVSTLSLPELPGGGKYDGSLMLQLQKDNTGVLDFFWNYYHDATSRQSSRTSAYPATLRQF